MLFFFIAETLDIHSFQTLLAGRHGRFLKLSPLTQLLYELRVIALALELLQSPIYLVSFVNDYSNHSSLSFVFVA